MMLLLALIAVSLAPQASAYYSVATCEWGGRFTDPIVTTESVRPFNIRDMSLLGVDSDASLDSELKCPKISIVEDKDIILAYTGYDAEGNEKMYLGNLTLARNGYYFTFGRVDRQYLPAEYENASDDALNVNWHPNGRLYISFFSDQEVVIRTCQPRTFGFGSSNAVYVYTSQLPVYGKIDRECMAENVRKLPQVSRFNGIFQTPETIAECTSATA